MPKSAAYYPTSVVSPDQPDVRQIGGFPPLRPVRMASSPCLESAHLPELEVDDRRIEGLYETFRSSAPDGTADELRLRFLRKDENLGLAAVGGLHDPADQIVALYPAQGLGNDDQIGHAHPANRQGLLPIVDQSHLEAVGLQNLDEVLAILVVTCNDQTLKHINFPSNGSLLHESCAHLVNRPLTLAGRLAAKTKSAMIPML